MAIIFEQPQAIAPAISTAYGAGEQAMSDFPAIAQAYGNAARMNQQTNLASAENATRTAMANADRIQQGGMFAGQLAQRQREMLSQQQMHNDSIVNQGFLQAQQAQAHMAAQVQAAQLNAWASQQDITFKEQQQLNLLKSKVADVQNDPNFSPEEKTRILSMIKFKVDPLEMKAQATQQKMMQQKMQMMQQQEAQVAAIKHLNDAYAAGNVESLPLFTDPLTGQQHRMLMNHQGEWYDPFTKARADAAKAQGKPEKTADEFGRTPQDYTRTRQAVAKTVDAAIKDGTAKPEERAKRIEAGMAELGFKGSLADHFPKPPTPQPPFQWDSPKTPEQKAAKQSFAVTVGTINARDDIPPPQKRQAITILTQARNLLAAYGSVQQMPEQLQQQYTMYGNMVKQIMGQPQAGGPPQQPPARPAPPPNQWDAGSMAARGTF
jgi:hypothetical protein